MVKGTSYEKKFKELVKGNRSQHGWDENYYLIFEELECFRE